MLTADLTVVDSHSSITLPGALGSKVYAQVATPVPGQTLRRIAATANTTPQEITINHGIFGKAGFGQRVRSAIRASYKDLTADASSLGGYTPSASFTIVIDRPVWAASYITDAILGNLVGAGCDVILTSGALGKILNREG